MIMNKDRERAVGAFRTYARLGLCNCGNALALLCAARGCCSDGTALDMLAVFDTLRLLEYSGKGESARAVREIYFSTSHRRVRANEITLRIRRLALESHCDERTVWRRLDEARRLWLLLRKSYLPSDAGSREDIKALLG